MNMFGKIRSCIIFSFLFIPFCALAQTKGTLTIVKSALIDTLIARRSSLNKANNIASDDGVNGFRVQIYFGSNRQDAYNAMAKFNAATSEFRTYITYIEPNFKVRAGDFRTRLEAEKLKKDLSADFTSVFIVPEKINPSKTDPSND